MSVHHTDIFYKTNHLSLDKKIELLNYSKELATHWHLDKLENSFTRKKIENATWDDVLNNFNIDSHFFIIHRRGYGDWKSFPDRWCGEIGYATFNSNKNIYLFLYISEDNLERIIEKFNLKVKLF